MNRPHLSTEPYAHTDVITDISPSKSGILTPPYKTHLKFHRNAVEVRKSISYTLNQGTHLLSIGDIDDAALESSFRLTILEGASGVISSKLIFKDDEYSTLSISAHQEDKTNLRDLRHHQKKRVADLEHSILKSDRAVNQASRLLLEWISQAHIQKELDLDEWKDGLILLEDTLKDRAVHHTSLQDALSRMQKQDNENNVHDHSSRQVLIELCVDSEHHYRLELDYSLHQAGWLPVYQARVDEELFEKSGTKPRVEARVHLDLSARFLQTTQETWTHCKAEFSLYPPVYEDFPVLNYPAYQSLDVYSQRSPLKDLTLQQGLNSPWASLCRLFSDQASISLTLELDLSSVRPQVTVIGAGSLDTLLPLGGGIIHRFVGDEWIGSNPIAPVLLGEQLSLNFGLFAPLEASVIVSPYEQSKDKEHKDSSIETESIEKISTVDSHEKEHSPLSVLPEPLEYIEVSIKNLDQQVRTVLVSHPLDRGMLVSEDEGRPPNSAPLGWVLSANRERLMRWVSIAPGRSECLNVLRKIKSRD